MMWALREVDGLGPVCLFCRRYTGPKFLDNGFDAICPECAKEIIAAAAEFDEEPEAKAHSRRRRKEVLVDA